MKRTLLAPVAAAAFLTALSTQAAEPPAAIAAAFGNTILSVYPDGRAQEIWLQPDGAWTGLSRRGNPLAGTWTAKGEKICLRQSKPPTLPISFCQVFPADPAKGVDSRDLGGTPIHLKLVKGHVERNAG